MLFIWIVEKFVPIIGRFKLPVIILLFCEFFNVRNVEPRCHSESFWIKCKSQRVEVSYIWGKLHLSYILINLFQIKVTMSIPIFGFIIDSSLYLLCIRSCRQVKIGSKNSILPFLGLTLSMEVSINLVTLFQMIVKMSWLF